ncbi:F-box protein At5g07610-like, partial [Aristolochia californica]|uniref:F-box protein At5g07610-like n=1 Tax=Aristolochia californica TaxID=171875 RepID=UPI0035D8B399
SAVRPRSINSYLGDDLFTEIFSRLPIKPLFRLKSVCKLWNRLISSDQLHGRLLLPHGLFYPFQACDSEPEEYRYICLSDSNSSDGGIQDISLSFLPRYPNLEIIDSCNGLILLLWSEMEEGTCQIEYYVCNPLTKRWIALPKPRRWVGFDITRLAFDPSLSPDFQVIHILIPSDWDVTSLMTETFSSASGQWVESIHRCVPVSHGSLPKDGEFMSGILYILCLPSYILGFNFGEGGSHLIRLPERRRHYSFLKCFRGCLYYVSHDNSVIDIWTLEDTSSSDWTLKHTVAMKALEKQICLPICDRFWHDLYYCSLQPFELHPEREAIVLKTHCKLFSYDFMSSRLEELGCTEECIAGSSHRAWFFESVALYQPWPNALNWMPSNDQG